MTWDDSVEVKDRRIGDRRKHGGAATVLALRRMRAATVRQCVTRVGEELDDGRPITVEDVVELLETIANEMEGNDNG